MTYAYATLDAYCTRKRNAMVQQQKRRRRGREEGRRLERELEAVDACLGKVRALLLKPEMVNGRGSSLGGLETPVDLSLSLESLQTLLVAPFEEGQVILLEEKIENVERLAQILATLNAHAIQALLDFAAEIPLQRHYWAGFLDNGSIFSLPYYILMTGPSRLRVGLQSAWAEETGLIHKLLSTSKKSLRPRAEIQRKLKHLAMTQKYAAGCIGLLVNNDLGQRMGRSILIWHSSSHSSGATKDPNPLDILNDWNKDFYVSIRTIQKALEYFQETRDTTHRREISSLLSSLETLRPEDPSMDVLFEPVTSESNRKLASGLVNSLSVDLPDVCKAIQAASFRPSVGTRLWVPIVSGSVLGLVALRHVSLRWTDIVYFVTEARKTAISLFQSWVFEPLYQMYETVRYKQSHLRIQGAESLESDLESLERMVVSFAKDSKGVSDPSILSDIAKRTLDGDLTIVLESYEEDLRSPIKSIATGHLIRPLLIQIQKAKVDAAMALSALDRLLRSNELNFTFLALLPLLGILGLTYSWTWQKYRSFEGFGKKGAFQMMRNGLRWMLVYLSLMTRF